MNCQEAQEWITSYLLNDLDEKSSGAIREHLEKCEGCRAVAREVQPTLDLLRDALAASSEAPKRLSATHRQRILKEGRPVMKTKEARAGWFTRPHPVLSHAALWIVCLSLVALFFGSMMLPALSSAREKSQRTSSMSSLAQVGKAIVMYSMDHNEKLPDSLDDLKTYGVNERITTDRKTGQKVRYGGKGLTADVGADQPIAINAESDKGANILYADGSVVWMNNGDELKKERSKLKGSGAGGEVAHGPAGDEADAAGGGGAGGGNRGFFSWGRGEKLAGRTGTLGAGSVNDGIPAPAKVEAQKPAAGKSTGVSVADIGTVDGDEGTIGRLASVGPEEKKVTAERWSLPGSAKPATAPSPALPPPPPPPAAAPAAPDQAKPASEHGLLSYLWKKSATKEERHVAQVFDDSGLAAKKPTVPEASAPVRVPPATVTAPARESGKISKKTAADLEKIQSGLKEYNVEYGAYAPAAAPAQPEPGPGAQQYSGGTDDDRFESKPKTGGFVFRRLGEPSLPEKKAQTDSLRAKDGWESEGEYAAKGGKDKPAEKSAEEKSKFWETKSYGLSPSPTEVTEKTRTAEETKSPEIIKGLYASRAKGGRESALRAYGGGGGVAPDSGKRPPESGADEKKKEESTAQSVIMDGQVKSVNVVGYSKLETPSEAAGEVPVVGDIPLTGRLFTDGKERQEAQSESKPAAGVYGDRTKGGKSSEPEKPATRSQDLRGLSLRRPTEKELGMPEIPDPRGREAAAAVEQKDKGGDGVPDVSAYAGLEKLRNLDEVRGEDNARIAEKPADKEKAGKLSEGKKETKEAQAETGPALCDMGYADDRHPESVLKELGQKVDRMEGISEERRKEIKKQLEEKKDLDPKYARLQTDYLAAVNKMLEKREKDAKKEAEQADRKGAQVPPSNGPATGTLAATLAGGSGGGGVEEGSVMRSLRWLKEKQADNGSWAGDVAATGVGLLSYLGYGETPASPEFGKVTEKAVKYLLAAQRPDGRFSDDPEAHAKAARAVSTAYGMTKIPALQQAAEKATQAVVENQAARGDVSGWEAAALKAAKVAGVAPGGVEKAMDQVADKLQRFRDDGEAAYGLQQLGREKEDATRQRLEALNKKGAFQVADEKDLDKLYFSHEARFNQGGEIWKQWNKQVMPGLTKRQKVLPDAVKDVNGRPRNAGYWDLPGRESDEKSQIYTTAMTALMNEVYYRYLPTFQKEPDATGQVVSGDGAAPANAPVASDLKIDINFVRPEDKKTEEEQTNPRFRAVGVNPFIMAKAQAFSTFAIDVDTASYTLARNYMLKGFLPPAESVRTEEFVNFFDYAYKPPEGDMFRVYAEVGPSKFGRGLNLLKIGVKGHRLGREQQRQAVLTFIIDTSGSMNQPDRIELVKKSLRMLVEGLGPKDLVAIVQYDSHARLVLDHTPASEKQKILDAIDSLQCGGSTNMEEGMGRGYEVAARSFAPRGENRVMLLSDGVANLGAAAAEDILANVAEYRRQGIYCSVFGFGIGAYDDVMLETLANKGDGTYVFIDSEQEAKRVLVDDLSATLNTIAKDVKIQVEFNPDRVYRYRQLGYENRQLKKEQFRDDTVDAGEVGSGQAVTALYEMEVRDQRSEVGGQRSEGPMATVRVRYKRVDTGKVEEIEQPVTEAMVAATFDETSLRFKLAVCAAEFAEILRGSPFAESSFEDLAQVLRPVALELRLDRNVQELLRMVEGANGMSRGE